MLDLTILENAYRAYVDTYRGADGTLPEMMKLKLGHTFRVVRAAKAIAAGEQFPSHTAAVCEAAALLHDTGRYEQLRLYNTFRDSDSVDHAVFSHQIVKEKGWLEGLPEKETILTSVLVHNRREIPADIQDPETLIACKTVRDADKLDIFRILEEQLKTTDWRNANQAFWGLSPIGPVNEAVVQAIEARRPVDYQNIKTLADFVLIQVGWMVSDLNFATSRHLCLDAGHLEFRRNFLHQLTDSPCIDRLCDLAESCLKAD